MVYQANVLTLTLTDTGSVASFTTRLLGIRGKIRWRGNDKLRACSECRKMQHFSAFSPFISLNFVHNRFILIG